MAKKELFDKPAKEAVAEVKEEKPNGDFQRLMAQAVVLDKETQDILTKDAGRCDRLNDDQKAEYINYLCSKIGIEPTFRPVDLIPTKNGLHHQTQQRGR